MGQRAVEGGSVRVGSYVVKKPVRQSVTVHAERATLDYVRREDDRRTGTGIGTGTGTTGMGTTGMGTTGMGTTGMGIAAAIDRSLDTNLSGTNRKV